MLVQRVGAFCLLSALVYVLFGVATPAAMAQDAVQERAPAKSKRIKEGGSSGGGGASCKYGPDDDTCGTEDPIEKCKRKCEEAWERENERCRKLRTRKQREKCWRENNEKRAKCVRDCED